MIRPILAAAALVALTATASVSQGSDCDSQVEAAMRSVASMKANGAKRVALARMIATGYDYCQAGMMLDAKKFFDMAASRER